MASKRTTAYSCYNPGLGATDMLNYVHVYNKKSIMSLFFYWKSAN